VASGKSGGFEGVFVRHDGVFRWFLARSSRRDAAGRSSDVRTSTDIDALKQAEAKLREDERGSAGSLSDTSNIVVSDPDGSPIYANQATLDYTGLTMATSSARTFGPESSTRKISNACATSARRRWQMSSV